MLLARLCVALLAALAIAGPIHGQTPDPIPSPAGEQDPVESAPLSLPGAEPGDMKLITRFSYYNHEDSGDGNPFLDEELTVVEPVVVFDHTVSERFGYALEFSYDGVSSASIDRLNKFPEQSGASGDDYLGVNLSGRWKLEEGWGTGAHVSYSSEYDYNSIGFGGNISRELDGKDATIGLSLNGFFDDIDIIRFDGSEEGSDDRISVSTTASWYQVISPTVHGSMGLTVTFQDGFLETPYNAVVIENPADPPNPNLENMARGTEITEELPDNRVRVALFGRVRKSLSPTRAVELGGRLYGDDWGVMSVAIEPRWYQVLVPGTLDGMVRYRYYVQTEADDYSDNYFVIDKYRTQDSDLADLDSHTLGGRLTWHVAAKDSLSLSLDYVLRSNGLDQILASVAWEHRF